MSEDVEILVDAFEEINVDCDVFVLFECRGRFKVKFNKYAGAKVGKILNAKNDDVFFPSLQ